nr:hypothetical protein [uncultured Desulfobacter sp.]
MNTSFLKAFLLKRTIPLIMFFLVMFNGMCGMGIAADDESDLIKLKAKVMVIDLINNIVIVAEQKFKLISHRDKHGTKVWDTRFLDKEGNQISPDKIETRDRVLVHGKNDNGTIIAKEVILLE